MDLYLRPLASVLPKALLILRKGEPARSYRLAVGYPWSGSAEVIIHSMQLRASARPCRAAARRYRLHQLRALVAALIAGSRFKTMIYLIKPHFCIVSRAFVAVRPAIIPARPLFPGHGIAIDDRDPPDRDSPPSPFALSGPLFISPPFSFFSFFFFYKSHVIAFAGGARERFPGKGRVQESLVPVQTET